MHPPDADGATDELTEEQPTRLRRCEDRLAALGIEPGVTHVANTAAAVRYPRTRLIWCGPGIGIFGLRRTIMELSPLWPVMSLRTRIIALREVPKAPG